MDIESKWGCKFDDAETKKSKKSSRTISASVIKRRKTAKESKRKVIMQAALDLFSISGVHGTSIETSCSTCKSI